MIKKMTIGKYNLGFEMYKNYINFYIQKKWIPKHYKNVINYKTVFQIEISCNKVRRIVVGNYMLTKFKKYSITKLPSTSNYSI